MIAEREREYVLMRGYGNPPFMNAIGIVTAIQGAVAAALNTGDSVLVCRVGTNGGRVELFRVNPASFDARKTAPELMLAMRALAVGLVPEIDQLAAPNVEGADQ